MEVAARRAGRIGGAFQGKAVRLLRHQMRDPAFHNCPVADEGERLMRKAWHPDKALQQHRSNISIDLL
jgi:hypothetical protein